jgi:hypothetical protein
MTLRSAIRSPSPRRSSTRGGVRCRSGLELALNWNTVASELHAGLAAVKRRTRLNQ